MGVGTKLFMSAYHFDHAVSSNAIPNHFEGPRSSPKDFLSVDVTTLLFVRKSFTRTLSAEKFLPRSTKPEVPQTKDYLLSSKPQPAPLSRVPPDSSLPSPTRKNHSTTPSTTDLRITNSQHLLSPHQSSSSSCVVFSPPVVAFTFTAGTE